MTVRKFFMSANDNRLRLGWRLFLQFVVLLILSGALALVILPLARRYGADTKIAIAQIATFLGTVASIYLARRFFDRRSFSSLGLRLTRRAGGDLLFGIVLGGVVMSVIFAIEWAAGWMQSPTWIDWQPGITLSLLTAVFYFVMVGVQEELFVRGYWLQNLNEAMKTGWAVLLTSVFFALGHLGNEGANLLSVLSLIAAGYLLAYGWMRTGQLWLPIGLHIGWNFFESALGFPVSGLENFKLVTHTVVGPEIWVGGAFGPESGLLSFVAMGLAALAIYFWTKRERGGENVLERAYRVLETEVQQ